MRSLDELFAAAPYVGFPAVVRPEFGASAMGCVRVDALEELPKIYSLVRSVVTIWLTCCASAPASIPPSDPSNGQREPEGATLRGVHCRAVRSDRVMNRW